MSYTKKYIVEAPTGEGENFKSEVSPTTIPDSEYKNFYLNSKFQSSSDRQDVVANIIVKVKEFLYSLPNKVYEGDYKAFRDELIPIILSVVPKLGTANAGYCARKIQDYLTQSKILRDERNGFKLEKKIETTNVVKDITPSIQPILDNEAEEPDDDNLVEPPFNKNIKYEKSEEDIDDLTEEEQEALDTIVDNETGNHIISRLQSKRNFRGQPIKRVYDIIKSLIDKKAILPVGGFDFDVSDELPGWQQHKRENKPMSESHFLGDKYELEQAYKQTKIINEGVLTNLRDRVNSYTPWSANTRAFARGNLQANKQIEQLYRIFLQQLGQSGYTPKTVTGNYLVNWLVNNFNSDILDLPEVKRANVDVPIQDVQKIFNNIIQASYRAENIKVTANNQVPTQPQPQVQAPAAQSAPPVTPAVGKRGRKSGIAAPIVPRDEYKNLVNAINAAPSQREKTRVINMFIRKYSKEIADLYNQSNQNQPGNTP